IEAAIALAEGRFHEARAGLEAQRARCERAAQTTPIATGLQRVVEALLVEACAGAGDTAAAQHYFDFATPFLRLHGHRKLLDRCESALGKASSPAARETPATAADPPSAQQTAT